MDWLYLPAVFGLNWLSFIVFVLLPLLTVGAVFWGKRRFLWAAPLLSAILAVLLAGLADPSLLRVSEYRAMFCGVILPIHLAVSAALTAAAYAAAYILKRMRK